ncbi:restriction endonuclease subunit S [Aeromonas hydrophila]|uniref:restriction endonuclease subunit S n=1 Tax=Aeromonas hydrophila TaxID=644 RepID=UPI001F5D9ACE|nr:restriction endonuclease subunit S [Aeromonas hydrophila]
MISFPAEWVETTLDNIADWGSGGTPSRKNEDYYGGDIPWVKTGDLGEKIIKKPSEYITELGLKNSSAKLFPKGAVAIAMYGATIGKASILGIDATTNQACAVGNPKPNVTTSEFLYYFLLNEKDGLVAKGKGGAQPNISQGLIKEHVVYLPPVAEQKEIVDRLDILLAQVEATQARLARIPDIIKQFRQSVLTAAVSGKLTNEWRKSNNVDLSSWIFDLAKNLCDKVQSGSTPKDNPFEQNGKIPFLKVYNIVNQRIDFDYKPQFVTSEVHSQKLKRSVALPDDVLMNIVGPPLGKVALLTNQYPEWNINQAITLFRTGNKKLLSKFLYFVLCEGCFVRDVLHDVKGIVGQVNISLSQCREAVIPCPSLKEQAEIVSRVKQLFAYADTLEQQAKAAKARVDNLTQAILAKAFRGELTADWRAANLELISDDNSAAALLARIQAERAAAKPRKRASKPAISPTSSGVTQ